MRMRRLMAVWALVTGLVLLGATTSVWADDVDGDGVGDAIDVCDNTPTGMLVDDEGRPLGDIDLDCDVDLDDFTVFQGNMTGPFTPPSMIIIDIVPVGNPGNAHDTRYETPGYGGVDYVYNIGKYEVTAGQYTAFLNAVAALDTYGLYNEWMGVSRGGCMIERTGSSPNYTYNVAVDWADRPVNYISWGDAARFANWLHNGQPTGVQGLITTEDGSYYLNGATTIAELQAITREPGATWVIPTEDEWYKASYHYNNGVTGDYYDYATSRHDSLPGYIDSDGNHSGTGSPFTEGGPDFGNYATYSGDMGSYGIGLPYYRTVVGEWENSASPYGTYDQGGNVWEWNEAIDSWSHHGIRGGSYSHDALRLSASYRESGYTDHDFGFRVAKID